MKNLLIPIISVFLLSLISCNYHQKIKIGFLYPTSKTERFVREARYFKDRAEELGYEVIVKQTDNDENDQKKQYRKMMEEGIDALVIIPISENSASSIVREANAAGIIAIAYVKLIKNCALDCFVGGNSKLVGEMIVDAALHEKPTGKYIVLAGDKRDRNAPIIMQSIDEKMAQYINSGDIQLVYKSYIEDWNEDNAAYELKKVFSLTGEKPDAIICCCDVFSDVAVKLCKSYGYDDVFISGQNAELRAIKNIVNDRQTITVFHPLQKLAYKVADAADVLLKKNKLSQEELTYVYNGMYNIPAIIIDPIKIDRYNIDKELIKTGFYTNEQVYGVN